MALFSKKPEEKSDAQYAVTSDAPKSGNVPIVKIPSVLVQPRISEKAGAMARMNKYVFKVGRGANKVEVKKAVELFYKVKVLQVNIVNNQGKLRNFGRTKGRTQGFKKAIVTLRKGDKIEGLTDGV